MDDTMCGNGLLGYFAGASWGDRRILAALTEGWINLYRIFPPDIVVADYAPTANTFFNGVIEQLVGLARRHAVPVIYMRRELHRMWLDGDRPTTRSRPTRPASSAPRTCASLPWPRRCRLSRQLLDGFRSA
jgi:hypothetical protein